MLPVCSWSVSVVHCHVKLEGAEPDVVIRLTTFYQLNCIRVVFRFLFCVPLLIMALDGIRGPYPIIGDPFPAHDGRDWLFRFICDNTSHFLPAFHTRESGYQAKPSSPHSSKLHPPSSPLPNYSDGRRFPSPKPTLARHQNPKCI
ncbi:hypothetical protein Hypma_007389 [Hypsizygus marmoreus]|uniref:Uncharacterized protein n=1 Tax=Hypsizygus marmoreus TaxID=39966 RepID=A0A369JUJ2_HYPMA|nr:hypothetical protein Hypma_007389 [Hypsizygus marmoreus]